MEPLFTGCDVDGGYAEYMTAPEDCIYPMPTGVSSRESAPFLCAGIIGYRAPRRRNLQKGETLGLYGFGASAHIVIVIQLALHWDCKVSVCARDDRAGIQPQGEITSEQAPVTYPDMVFYCDLDGEPAQGLLCGGPGSRQNTKVGLNVGATHLF